MTKEIKVKATEPNGPSLEWVLSRRMRYLREQIKSTKALQDMLADGRLGNAELQDAIMKIMLALR